MPHSKPCVCGHPKELHNDFGCGRMYCQCTKYVKVVYSWRVQNLDDKHTLGRIYSSVEMLKPGESKKYYETVRRS